MLSLDEVEAAGGYTVIYADAPWRYTQNGRGAAENHYRTMSLEEIRALPVARIAAPTSVLFLWGTWPKLLEVQSVIPAWGFEYKTLGFTWIKHYGKSEKPFCGGGSWTRSNEEFCLLAVRGKPRRADTQAASTPASIPRSRRSCAIASCSSSATCRGSSFSPASASRVGTHGALKCPEVVTLFWDKVDVGDDPKLGAPDVDLTGG